MKPRDFDLSASPLDLDLDDPSKPSLFDVDMGVEGSDPHQVLSNHELRLNADMHVYFEKQQQKFDRETVELFDELCCPERVDLMEVCAPWDSPLSEAVERLGGTTVRLGLHNGFDMSTKSGLRKALALLRRVKPRYVHLSPPCFPFTIMQNANQRTPEQKQQLEMKRNHGRKILENCCKLLEVQIQELGCQGGFSHDGEMHDGGGEQPLRALSWKEPALRKASAMCGGRFRVDGCCHGLIDGKTNKLMQKSFGWLSNNMAIRKAIQRTCNHKPDMHIPVEGGRTASSAVYPKLLCSRFARALLFDRSHFKGIQKQLQGCQVFVGESNEGNHEGNLFEDSAEPSSDGNGGPSGDQAEPPTDDPVPNSEDERELGFANRRGELLRKIRVLHSNLGHPSSTALVRLLKQAGAPEEVTQIAQTFECDVCRQRGRRASTIPSALPAATNPWEVISVDTFWWSSPHKGQHGKSVQNCGVSFLDECTNFHIVSVVRVDENKTPASITADEFRKSFASTWLKHFPKPQHLRYDCEGFFRSLNLQKWVEAQGIHLQPIAGEAAWQLGRQSRHLETVKENASLLSLELGESVDCREVFDLCTSAKNEMHIHKGYSPNQWAFGQQKDRIESYLQHGDALSVQSGRNHDMTFEETLQHRNEARIVFLRNDARKRIQRALNARARKAQTFVTGELVYFFRRGRGHGNRYESYWFGPARVVCVEKTGDVERNQSLGSIVWIAHGTTLFRCAPEQLRHVTHSVQNLSQEFWDKQSPSDILQNAKNSQRYHNLVPELELLDEHDALQDEDPDQDSSLLRLHTDPTVPGVARYRARGKQTPYDGSENIHGTSAEPGSEEARDRRTRSVHLREHALEPTGRDEAVGRQTCGQDDQGGSEGRRLRTLAPSTPRPESQVSGPTDLCPPSRSTEHRRCSLGSNSAEGRRGTGNDSQEQSVAGHQVNSEARKEFDDFCARQRHSQGAERSHGRQFQHTGGRSSSDEPIVDGDRRREESGQQLPGSQPSDSGSSHATAQPHDGPSGGVDTSRTSPDHSGGPSRSDGFQHSTSRVRSRSRGRQSYLEVFHSDIPVVDQCEPLSEGPEDFAVGCVQANSRSLSCIEEVDFHGGCFEWLRNNEAPVQELEAPGVASQFFCWLADEVLEIQMTVAPRDVHCQRRNGVAEWVLNQKPKKNAEVNFKKLNDEEKQEMLGAMKGEVSSFLEREAIDVASRHGIDPNKLLSMRWVLTYKPISDESGNQVGTKPKARLIIRGFEDPNLLHLRRDSPTLALANRNTLFALSAMWKWPIFAGDIKTAFLNGDVLPENEHLFGDPPQEVRDFLSMKPSDVLRIKKVIYGLLNAPRAWMDKLSKVLEEQGWQKSRLEQCVWRLFDSQGQLCGLLGCHVDDLLVSGVGDFFEQKVVLLRNSFPFGSWQKAQDETITFCGCEVTQDVNFNIFVSQERYALGLREIPLSTLRKKEPDKPASVEEQKQLKAALGGLSWRATQTCPWIAASVSVLQGCQKSPTVEHLMQVNKLVREQRHHCETALKFSSAVSKPVLITYTDASWACRIDGSSQGGQLTLLADMDVLHGSRSEYSILSWQSRKLARIARSSTSAEVQMASNATDNHEFMKQIFLEWFNPNQEYLKNMDSRMKEIPSVLILDSKNLFDALSRIETSGLQLEERRTAIEVLSIRERTQQAGICVKWCDSDQQLADGLSKPFHYDQLVEMFSLGVISIVFDPLFTSAKKKRQMARQERLEKVPAVAFKDSADSRNQCQKEKETDENPVG